MKRVEENWDSVQADLETIRKSLLSRNGLLINLTADAKVLSSVDSVVSDFVASLPDKKLEIASWSGLLPSINEALIVPTQVCEKKRNIVKKLIACFFLVAAVAVVVVIVICCSIKMNI